MNNYTPFQLERLAYADMLIGMVRAVNMIAFNLSLIWYAQTIYASAGWWQHIVACDELLASL